MLHLNRLDFSERTGDESVFRKEKRHMKRVFLIVLDSVGIGEMPDAAAYGDEGTNTLKAAASSPFFHLPNLARLGLFHLDGVD